jgi:tetraprenyl-beta-curcumene synthase
VDDPARLSLRQLHALVTVYGRELTWIAPNVGRQVRVWRERAQAIPDATLREDALVSLKRERLNLEGAALFCSLPRQRHAGLLRLLVAYQIVLDYLDTLGERPGGNDVASGLRLHQALVDALNPAASASDYYRHHPWRDDGGYLQSLVEVCQAECAALPSFARVQAPAMRVAARFAVQVANHDPDPARRDAFLIEWAEREFPDDREVAWFEHAAAASSTLGVHALLALAADPAADDADVAAVDAAYVPWVCAASTLLDSYVDQRDDDATGSHSFIAHYADLACAAQRLQEIVERGLDEARQLHRGLRHAVIAGGMVAMYLSKAGVALPDLRPVTDGILRAGGSLTAVELPILRLLRIVHRLDSA